MSIVNQSDFVNNLVIAYPLHGNCYLNITNRCTLRCPFCPKHRRTWEVQSYDLALPREPTVAEVIAAVGDPAPYDELVFCGLGEPTQRLDVLLAVAAHFKSLGSRIRVNSDGLANLIHDRDVVPEMAAVVDAISISLNAQNEALYIQHTHPKREGAWDAVLDFATRAHAAGIEVTLTAIDGLEGVDIEAWAEGGARLGVTFRRRVLDLVG
jgi:TatD family-associated radical SAM protein